MAFNLVTELDAQLREVAFGIRSADPAARQGAADAVAKLVTLEDAVVAIRMDGDGVHVLSVEDDGTSTATASFDSVNSLLLNTSPGFTQKFNESLAAALAAAAAERGQEDEDDDDYKSFKSYDSGQDDRPWH